MKATKEMRFDMVTTGSRFKMTLADGAQWIIKKNSSSGVVEGTESIYRCSPSTVVYAEIKEAQIEDQSQEIESNNQPIFGIYLLTLKSPVSLRLNRKSYSEAPDDFFVVKFKTLRVEQLIYNGPVESLRGKPDPGDQNGAFLLVTGFVMEDSSNTGIWEADTFGGPFEIQLRNDLISSRQTIKKEEAK